MQGFVAGINAVLKSRNEEPFVLQRSEAYIGVLVDDLVTKGTQEPYRIFTSRAEYRLLLREDNADYRLMEMGRHFGLVGDDVYARFQDKHRQVVAELVRLNEQRIGLDEKVQETLRGRGSAPLKESATLADLLRRPELSYQQIVAMAPPAERLTQDAAEHVEAVIKYESYIKRQVDQADKLKRLEDMLIPESFDYAREALNLSTEARQKLAAVKPRTLGQASRISGVSPADLSAMMILLHKRSQTVDGVV